MMDAASLTAVSPTRRGVDGARLPAPASSAAAPARRWSDVAVRAAVVACAGIVVAATLAVLLFVGRTGARGIGEVGLGGLVAGTTWKPEAGAFGGLPLLFGTFVSAAGAIAVGAAPAVLAAIWVVELAPRKVRAAYQRVMEVAAALPSVVYGWLALLVLVPRVETIAHLVHGESARVGGEGLAAAAILLGLMIAPTVLLLSLDALARVPPSLRDASAALGASRWQTAFRVAAPYAWRRILVAVFFGFARAAGETMAVQMVIGGARRLPSTLFSPATTVSTQIVMDMQNARPGTPAADALFSMALVLLVLSAGMVIATRALMRRTA